MQMLPHDNEMLATCLPIDVTAQHLRSWSLPDPDSEADKDARGSVLVVGGTRELPGAIVLSGIAALRAGAGKLQIGTAHSIAVSVGIAVPEALVFGLDEKNEAEIEPSVVGKVAERASSTVALLVGPGLLDIDSTKQFVSSLVPRLNKPRLVLDAGGLHCLRDTPDLLHALDGNVVLTPHIGEMANMMRMEKEEVAADPLSVARRAARRWRAVVALKGATTHVVTPDDDVYCWSSGNVGLATSGSGDTLAGIVAGLFARGATAAQAAVWGVYLHGEAGNVLSRRIGPIGFLAREILAEIPQIMAGFSGSASRR